MNARDGGWIWDSGAVQGLLEARGVWKCKESLFYGFIYSDAEIQMIPTHLLAGAAQK